MFDSPAEDPRPATPLLALCHATVVRGGRVALDDLTFEIQEGRHTAILGPNGCGKSSFIRLLNRQDYPLHHVDGECPIRILGKDRWDLFDLRTHLGIVSADLHQAFLIATAGGRRSGREVVLSGFFASQGVFAHQAVTPAMVERADLVLSLVGATHLADNWIDAMSTGEARRILIARALAPDPQALLLDEPTTGLDLVARHHFLGMLQAITRHGKTILLVTHHIEEILPQIQRVILMKEGRVFLDGPKEDVLTTQHLSALYGETVMLRQVDGHYTALCQEA